MYLYKSMYIYIYDIQHIIIYLIDIQTTTAIMFLKKKICRTFLGEIQLLKVFSDVGCSDFVELDLLNSLPLSLSINIYIYIRFN